MGHGPLGILKMGNMPKVEKCWSIWIVSNGILWQLIADSDVNLLTGEVMTFFLYLEINFTVM